jgi:plexin A
LLGLSIQTIPLAPEELEEKIQCRVLDCDTISQVKHKILDALYRHTPFSLRPAVYEVDLGKDFFCQQLSNGVC